MYMYVQYVLSTIVSHGLAAVLDRSPRSVPSSLELVLPVPCLHQRNQRHLSVISSSVLVYFAAPVGKKVTCE